MKNGLPRFTFYLQKIEALLNKAGGEKNPALWLFSNNARTPFFMLESLARLYAELHNPKKFGKLKEQFKLIEDGFGQIDYYNSLSLAFTANKSIPADCRKYIKKQLDISVDKMNLLLDDKDWLSAGNKRIIKITGKLNEAGWLKPSKEIEAIANFYEVSIASINKFVVETRYHFENVETDVHELRRKLRWLSIYPQSFQGAIQYATETRTPANLKKYLTKEIINSPYNIMPAAGPNISVLMLSKNYFLALSWMIAELGRLKDEGLLITGLCEALQVTTGCDEEEALKKAYTLLGRKYPRMQKILDDSEVITKIFFKDKILDNLVVTTAG